MFVLAQCKKSIAIPADGASGGGFRDINTWVFKFRSQCTELIDLFYQVFPDAKVPQQMDTTHDEATEAPITCGATPRYPIMWTYSEVIFFVVFFYVQKWRRHSEVMYGIQVMVAASCSS